MKFKCKSTGLVYSFEFEVDILSMQKHPDYEEVSSNDPMPDNSLEEQEEVKEAPKKKSSSKAVKDSSSNEEL